MDYDRSQTPGEKRELRENLSLLRKAIKWDIPAEKRKQMVADAIQLAESAATDRDRLRAIELLRSMCKDDVDLMIELDRIERLEAGQKTEDFGKIEIVFKDNPVAN